MTDALLTEAQLLAQVERSGYAVTPHRLKRLRAVGLMPRPAVRHGVVRGSRSFYPGWAADQLVAVCRVQKRERRFDELRVLVWWEGDWVDPSALREAMSELLAPLARELAQYAELDPYDAADELSSELAGGRSRSATGSLLRSRVRDAEDRRSMMSTIALLVFGGDPAWDIGPAADDREESLGALFERASGIDRARDDEISDDGPWLLAHDEVADMLEPLRDAGFFDMIEPGRVLGDASDIALEQAREDVRFIMQPLGIVARVIEAQRGMDIGGLGSLRALADDATDPAWLVWLVRSLLIIRQVVGDEHLDAVRAQLKALGFDDPELPEMLPRSAHR
jgi:hypothetical protein